jgi:hypothetical protein
MCSRRNSSIESHPEYYRTKNERRTEASGSEDEGGGVQGREREGTSTVEREYRTRYSPRQACSVPLETQAEEAGTYY